MGTQHAATTYAQELYNGQVIPLGSYTVSKAELVDFAQQWDPQGFHIDDEIAKTGYFGEVIASGIHTLAIMQRLLVKDQFEHWAIIAGKSMDALTFDRPVFAGDTLTGEVRVGEMTHDARGRSHIEMFNSLTNQHGKIVMTAVVQVLMHTAPTPEAQR